MAKYVRTIFVYKHIVFVLTAVLRYTPELKESRHQYSWIPFGMGNRSCIAMRLALMEMKIGLAAIVRNYKIETCDETLVRLIC